MSLPPYLVTLVFLNGQTNTDESGKKIFIYLWEVAKSHDTNKTALSQHSKTNSFANGCLPVLWRSQVFFLPMKQSFITLTQLDPVDGNIVP